VTPTRPVLRYHGGKWRLAPWIIGFFPVHRVYVEPFGGGASVLMRKPPASAEIYNDLDSRIVSMFRVLRDPILGPELNRQVALTPYAREEHERSYEDCDDQLEQARRTIIRGMMGHGSRGATSAHRTGFRTARRRGIHAAADWASYSAALAATIERLRDVLIERRDACAVMQEFDGPECLHYVDPPYPAATRTTNLTGVGRAYAHELTDADHRRLADVLRALTGYVVLSGYPCDLYDRELYPDWQRFETGTLADGRIARTEVVWLNAACTKALRGEDHQHPLFEVPA
jgi:DNA adenine methylase